MDQDPFMTDPAHTQKKNRVLIPKGSHNFLPKQINKKYNYLNSVAHLQHLIHAVLNYFVYSYMIPSTKLITLMLSRVNLPCIYVRSVHATKESEEKALMLPTSQQVFFCTAILCMQVKGEQIDTNKHEIMHNF